MLFLGIGILLMVLKYQEVGIVATWSWLVVLSPFAMAVAWWTWSDMSGRTKRLAVEKMDKRKEDRIAKSRDALGIGTGKQRRR